MRQLLFQGGKLAGLTVESALKPGNLFRGIRAAQIFHFRLQIRNLGVDGSARICNGGIDVLGCCHVSRHLVHLSAQRIQLFAQGGELLALRGNLILRLSRRSRRKPLGNGSHARG